MSPVGNVMLLLIRTSHPWLESNERDCDSVSTEPTTVNPGYVVLSNGMPPLEDAK